ncbi:MAG: isoprenylcysteine carboxylmethyltransferase family protein [Acidimicrobiales bacterium]
MTEAAFVGYALLITLAFGVRTLLHIRQTGHHGWLPASSRVGAIGDGTFSVGVAAALGGTALTLFGVLGEAEPAVALGIFGLVLVYGGAAIALMAQAQMGEAWRAGVDVQATSQLVVGGLYRFSRNPFYVGMILATAGVALAVPQVTTALGLVLVSAGSYIDARYVEEPVLVEGHGDTYARYRERTARFFPRPRRLTR